MSGANRYPNPDEDLPGDFVRERETYYINTLMIQQAQKQIRHGRVFPVKVRLSFTKQTPRHFRGTVSITSRHHREKDFA